MKRLPGIIISAIVLLLLSLLQLLFAALMAFAGVIEHTQIQSSTAPAPPLPPWMPIFMGVVCAIFLALAAWGILTSIGLFRMRRWARFSILIIGGCLAVMGLFQTLTSIVLLAVPFPLPANVDPSKTSTMHTVTSVMFIAMAAVYAIVSTVGISWLVYFNLKKVRELFTAGLVPTVPNPRPILISVIAVLNMIGAPSCLLMAFLPYPGFFLGFLLYGWRRAVVYLAFGTLATIVGIGLWRLDERARRLAIALQVLGLAQNAVIIARPSLMTNYMAQFNSSLNLPQTPMPAQFQTTMNTAMFGLGTVVIFAVVAVLLYYRRAFKHPGDPLHIEPATTL